MPKTDYTRDELIKLCEAASVPQAKWRNRDSSDAQRNVGELWALLRAGCEYAIIIGEPLSGGMRTDDKTIWVRVLYIGFTSFEDGGDHLNSEPFYLPTQKNIDEADGGDWY